MLLKAQSSLRRQRPTHYVLGVQTPTGDEFQVDGWPRVAGREYDAAVCAQTVLAANLLAGRWYAWFQSRWMRDIRRTLRARGVDLARCRVVVSAPVAVGDRFAVGTHGYRVVRTMSPRAYR